MANRTFEIDGFWDRVEEAIQGCNKTKIQVAKEMGVGRKALYPNSSSSWHSGRIASFCRATGVSADWLLGLSQNKRADYPAPDNLSFMVVDTRTGKEPIYDRNHLFKEKWFKESPLIYCDISCWAIDEDGYLMLVDDCNNIAYPPQDRFKAVFYKES